MKYSILFLWLAFQLPVSGIAQDTYFLSLDELFRLGIENSLQLKASHIQEIIADNEIRTARIVQTPDIHIRANTGYIGRPTVFRQGLTQATRPEVPPWSHNYQAEAIQILYNGGKIRRNIRQASLKKQIAALYTTSNRAEIKMLLLQQYTDLFYLYKQKEVLRQTIEESQHRLEDIRRMRKEGLVTRNDEIRSELQLTNDQLALREANDRISIVSQQLDAVLGLDETLLLRPDTSALFSSLPLQNCDDYIRQAYSHYPELQTARYHTILAQQDIRQMQADYLPSLSLKAANTLSRPLSSTLEDVFSHNWNIGLTLSYNLSSLYQNKHKVHEARQYMALRQNAEDQVRQDLRLHVRSAYIRHREALDRVGALLLSVKQAKENYRIVRNRYMNQLSILTDLLDASNVRLEAELQLTQARTEVIYTYYELMRSCGNL